MSEVLEGKARDYNLLAGVLSSGFFVLSRGVRVFDLWITRTVFVRIYSFTHPGSTTSDACYDKATSTWLNAE